MEELIGKTIGRYVIESKLGEGGMASVYQARDNILERKVAIKIILPDLKQSSKFLKRFDREAQALAQLSHPNIVKILDYGKYEGYPYLVMEYISNGNLQDLIKRQNGPIDVQKAGSIISTVARALDHAHQHKLVHRDVKPSNILINDSGQPMLSDFGIVKIIEESGATELTATGMGIGTPHYISPEQAQGKVQDGRSDQYSLGVIFYEMITGVKPYLADSQMEVALKHVNEPVPHARQTVRSLPAAIDQIIYKTMAKNVNDRFASMKDFAEAVESQIPNWSSSQPFKVVQVKKKTTEPGKQKKGVVWIAASVFIVAAIAIGLVMLKNGNTENSNAEIAALETMENANESVSELATPTRKIIETIAPTESNEELQSSVEIQIAENAISPDNIENVIELNRLDYISVVKMDWSSDGKIIADGGGSGIVFIDPLTLKETSTYKSATAVVDLTFSPDNQYLAYISNATINIIDVVSNKISSSIQVQGTPNSLAYSPDGKTMAICMLDNKVLLYDIAKGTLRDTLKGNFGGWAVEYSSDGKYLASGSSQGVLMWEADTGYWLPISTGQKDLIKGIAFSPDNKSLAAGGSGIIRIWNTENGAELFSQSLNIGNVNDIAFSPDGKLLVAASEAGDLMFFDVNKGKLIRTISAHNSSVFSSIFSPNGQLLVSGANEGTIRIWGLP